MLEKDVHAIIALGDRARELFVKTKGAVISGGEAGEVMLYLALEAIIKAPLLVSKMSLKTNANMNVHGRDGIHVRYSPALKGLVLYLGEAKLHAGLSDAVDDAINSITTYLSNLALRQREIAIVNANMDLTGLPPDAEDHLRQMLDPYASPPGVYHTIHSCFIGFEYAGYKKISAVDPDAMQAAFCDLYLKRATQIREQISIKVAARLPPPTKLHFFVMPFPDLGAFRKAFAQKLGVSLD